MDPISHAMVGATAAQVVASALHRPQKEIRVAGVAGMLAGMAPDLDVLIRSATDPLLQIEFHRQFTHSFIFIPFGAWLAAVFFKWTFFKSHPFKNIFFYSLAGFGLHGLLDACTSYGTLLYWPFSYQRVEWNIISIVDPLFTLPLLGGFLFRMISARGASAKYFFIFALLYLSFGFIQKNRAENFTQQWLKENKVESVSRLEVRPSFANLIVWKALIETPTHYQSFSVRSAFNSSIKEGDAWKKLDWQKWASLLPPDTQMWKDLKRFEWFSIGWIAEDPLNPGYVGDIRFSTLPHQIKPMWSIKLDPTNADHHVQWVRNVGRNKESFLELWSHIRGLGY